MDFETSSPGAFSGAQQQLLSHAQPRYNNQNAYALPHTFSASYPTAGLPTQSHHSHQRNHSASSQSTHSSAHRSSDGSVFSSWQPRSSIASTNTAWTQFSDLSSEQYIAQTEQMLEARSPITSPPPSEESMAFTSAPSKRAHERQHSQDAKPLPTCVLRTSRRTRSSGKEPRYWCTACGEGFREKYDWKRHEETYRERMEKFECELCLKVYYIDKDFEHHHMKSHRCQVCKPKNHVQLARRKLTARTGWGCGFCIHFSTNWTERCNHISEHFEKWGNTMDDWRHSRVIWSLLQRPEILLEWCDLLERKQRTQNPFSWRPEITGRSEGYPETNAQPQLQDLLEFYTPSQDAAAIARLAFELGLREKKCPKVPPPLPEKDRYLSQPPQQPHLSKDQHLLPFTAADIQDAMSDPAWSRFLGTISEDPFTPTDVTMLVYDDLNAAFDRNYNQF